MAFALKSKFRGKTQGAEKPAPNRKSARGQHSSDSRSGFEMPVFQPLIAAPPITPVIQANLKTGEPARPGQSGILQRKCACGGASGMSGGCEECGKKQRLGLQTKLKVNEPGDAYEREADRIAEQVLATPAHTGVSATPLHIQRFSGPSNGQMDAVPASVNHALASRGRPLEPALRQDMEQRFGHDFSKVRVHTGAVAGQSAHDANANAFTMGRDVVFGAGQYAPGTNGGRRLIAHELTHVVQQGAGQSINHVGPSHGEVIQRFPRLMPRPKPRIRFGAPELPPVPPVFPIPADRPNPNPELNNPEDLEDRRQRRCGTYALPETVVTFYPGPKGQGSRVKASPLTLCPGNTRGSKPLESIYQKQFECIKAAGESGKWLRGHLLHGETDRTGDRHLHGPGNTPANLIIITQSLNQQMRSWIEDSALKLVHGPLPHVLWMDVVVDSYHPGLEFFAESISVEYGPYRTSTGREGSPWKRKQFFDLKKPPHCPSYGLWPEGAVPPWVGGSALNTFGFQSTLFIHGGGKANRLSSRNFDVNTGGLIVAIDAKLVPPKCTVEHYYVELMKDKFGRDEQMSRSEISVYPEKWRQVLMWRGLLPGEYYLQIWREDEGVFRKTAGCDLTGDITVDTFGAPAPEPLPDVV